MKLMAMRKAVLFFSVVLGTFCCLPAIAQQLVTTEISSVQMNGKNVDFTIVSSRPFIFAGNRYVLHAGSKEFFRYQQSKDNGKGVITFFVPVDDFNNLREGAGMYLTYGDGPDNEAVLEARSKTNPVRCASLGKFTKQLLK